MKTDLPSQKAMINDVRRTLTQARLFRQAWWTITGVHPQRDAIFKALSFYPSFFGTVTPALWIAYTTNLASLFDRGTESITLRSVPGIDTQPGFDALWEKGRVLYRYRSKLIAHRDAKLTERNFAAESGLSADILEWILETSCQYFDAAVRVLDDEPVPRLSCEPELLQLVDVINQQYPGSRPGKP